MGIGIFIVIFVIFIIIIFSTTSGYRCHICKEKVRPSHGATDNRLCDKHQREFHKYNCSMEGFGDEENWIKRYTFKK